MTGPRPINNGTVAGWGLVMFITAVSGVMATAAVATLVWCWKGWKRRV